MSITILPAIREDKPRKDGSCAILIRVLFQRKVVVTQSIGKYTEAKYWDAVRRCVKRSHPDAAVINASIINRQSEIQQLMERFAIERKPITVTGILNLIDGKDVGSDFYQFCEEHIQIKYCNTGQAETRKGYKTEVNKLKKYRPKVNFYDIDYNFLAGYKAFMVGMGNHPNTVWKSFKFMKTMFNDAIRAEIFSGKSPFHSFDYGRYKQGVPKFMEIEDCRAIHQFLLGDIPDKIKLVGYYYLFMCYTGLRFGDAVCNFNYDLHVIDNERICICTQKAKVEINLYINDLMRPILDFVKENKLVLSNQKFNMYLKVLGTLAGVAVPLTAHVGRHTFGAMLAELETSKEVAQKLLGHLDIKSTNIYYHLKDKSLDNAMRNLDKL